MARNRVFVVAATVAVVTVAVFFGLTLALPAVPDLTGVRLSAAEARLLAGGLRPGLITTVAPRPGGQPSGRVVSQSAAPGTRVPVFTAVDLGIAAYPEIYDLPDLTGWWARDIRSLLDSEGVLVSVTCIDPAFQLDDGVITSTTPPPGPILRADGVTLTVTTLHGFRVLERVESPILHAAWNDVHGEYVRHYGSDGSEPCSGCHERETCGEKPDCHTPPSASR